MKPVENMLAGFVGKRVRRLDVRASVGAKRRGKGWRNIVLFVQTQNAITVVAEFGPHAGMATTRGFHHFYGDQTRSAAIFDLRGIRSIVAGVNTDHD